MYPKRINERKKWLEQLLNDDISVELYSLDDKDDALLSIGRNRQNFWGVNLPKGLLPRELKLIERLSHEWDEIDRQDLPHSVEDQLSQWLLKSLTSPQPLSESLHDQIDWRQKRIPFLFTITLKKQPYNWIGQIKEALIPYLSSETLFIFLSSKSLLALAPLPNLIESQDVEEGLKEWVSGVYDVCQHELSFITRVAYHRPFTSSIELIERVKDLHTIEEVLQWKVSISEIITPWELVTEQMINELPLESRKRIIALFNKNGEQTLLEQREWAETLHVFFRSNLNVSSAAKELYIHRNTLLYRLDRIASETGLDPRSFQDATYLQIILLLFEYENRYQR